MRWLWPLLTGFLYCICGGRDKRWRAHTHGAHTLLMRDVMNGFCVPVQVCDVLGSAIFKSQGTSGQGFNRILGPKVQRKTGE